VTQPIRTPTTGADVGAKIVTAAVDDVLGADLAPLMARLRGIFKK
jgi:hypothetical protein